MNIVRNAGLEQELLDLVIVPVVPSGKVKSSVSALPLLVQSAKKVCALTAPVDNVNSTTAKDFKRQRYDKCRSMLGIHRPSIGDRFRGQPILFMTTANGAMELANNI